MMSMRKSLRSGKLWIDHSLSFRERDQVLIPSDEWARDRDRLLATLGLGSSADRLLDPLLANLKAGLSAVAEACAAGKIHIGTDGMLHLPAVAPMPSVAISCSLSRVHSSAGMSIWSRSRKLNE